MKESNLEVSLYCQEKYLVIAFAATGIPAFPIEVQSMAWSRAYSSSQIVLCRKTILLRQSSAEKPHFFGISMPK
ncbi:MAG: hypothetical protein J0H66_02605 [Solirubrobacterales bacterium]|nr:hypothetical protein [Solirubrobacterales bacterium]OJU95274.1 MAG: hypothetical protein BGO23_05275 [Solirubrobacterales bacterium 67-14]